MNIQVRQKDIVEVIYQGNSITFTTEGKCDRLDRRTRRTLYITIPIYPFFVLV